MPRCQRRPTGLQADIIVTCQAWYRQVTYVRHGDSGDSALESTTVFLSLIRKFLYTGRHVAAYTA